VVMGVLDTGQGENLVDFRGDAVTRKKLIDISAHCCSSEVVLFVAPAREDDFSRELAGVIGGEEDGHSARCRLAGRSTFVLNRSHCLPPVEL
jgi:hypothetical protein